MRTLATSSQSLSTGGTYLTATAVVSPVIEGVHSTDDVINHVKEPCFGIVKSENRQKKVNTPLDGRTVSPSPSIFTGSTCDESYGMETNSEIHDQDDLDTDVDMEPPRPSKYVPEKDYEYLFLTDEHNLMKEHTFDNREKLLSFEPTYKELNGKIKFDELERKASWPVKLTQCMLPCKHRIMISEHRTKIRHANSQQHTNLLGRELRVHLPYFESICPRVGCTKTGRKDQIASHLKTCKFKEHSEEWDDEPHVDASNMNETREKKEKFMLRAIGLKTNLTNLTNINSPNPRLSQPTISPATVRLTHTSSSKSMSPRRATKTPHDHRRYAPYRPRLARPLSRPRDSQADSMVYKQTLAPLPEESLTANRSLSMTPQHSLGESLQESGMLAVDRIP